MTSSLIPESKGGLAHTLTRPVGSPTNDANQEEVKPSVDQKDEAEEEVYEVEGAIHNGRYSTRFSTEIALANHIAHHMTPHHFSVSGTKILLKRSKKSFIHLQSSYIPIQKSFFFSFFYIPWSGILAFGILKFVLD